MNLVGGEGDDAVGGCYGGLVRHGGEMWRCTPTATGPRSVTFSYKGQLKAT